MTDVWSKYPADGTFSNFQTCCRMGTDLGRAVVYAKPWFPKKGSFVMKRMLFTGAALLTLVMENAWDADVLCSVRGRADKVRARISHDEWFELLGPPPELAESAGQQPLI